MIDTIVLTIPYGKYKIISPERFHPHPNILFNTGKSLVKCANNPTKEDKNNDIYKPRLTLMKRWSVRGLEITLKIEFSAPKILFNNNADEIAEHDFEDLIIAINRALVTMGIAIAHQSLKDASVSAIHFAKNILITDGYTAQGIIKEINKINLNQKLDIARVTFINDGTSLQCYSKSHSLVIYDKVSDMNKAKKRPIDTDQSIFQLSLWDVAQTSNKRLEILRIEARLSKRQKLKQILNAIGHGDCLTFQSVFRKDVCQKAVLYYWDKIVLRENLFLFDMNNKPVIALQEALKEDLKLKPKEAIYLVGLNLLCKEGGIRTLRSIIVRSSHQRTWDRIITGVKKLNRNTNIKNCHGWIKQVADQLRTFEPFKLSTCDVKNSKV